ncbi:MAG: CHASE domain-containing protein [Candidatus Rokubacteria bacterium]|nr:CHASE domain-containing protein [Candidatus Rokubacteria bacterium]
MTFLSDRSERWLPAVAAIAMFALSMLAAFYAASATTARERRHFDESVRHAEDAIKQRLAAHIAMLRAGTGLFAATREVDRAQFHAYVQRLDLGRVYPGVQGIGVSLRVSPRERDELVDRMRRQGLAGFRIWPEQERAEYHAIAFLEPFDRRNRAAIGYDMFTETTRRAAMERARDTGEPAASARVTLVQEIDERKQPGFLIYVPMYRGGATPPTVAERRGALIGFMYSPFRAIDLLEGILGRERDPALGITVHDGDAPRDDTRLYRAGVGDAAGAFAATRRIDVAGRVWTLVFTARTPASALSARTVGAGILSFGAIASALLFTMLRAEVRGRRMAEGSARQLAEAATSRERALARERHARGQAERLAAVSRALTSTLDVARLGQMIVDSVRALTGTGASILYRVDERPAELRLFASSGDVGPALVPGTVIPASTGAVGLAMRERRPVATPNFMEDARMAVPPAVQAWLAAVPHRSVLALPLVAHDRLIGALVLGDEAGRVFTDEEVSVADAFASQAATALENARLLEEAETARTLAEHANRAKDEFLATVSHELRTPLNAILGWARMLRGGTLAPEQGRHALDVIERNARTQAQLIDDLLDVSRITTGKVQLDVGVVDLARVIDAAVDAVRPAADGKRVQLTTAVAPGVGRVAGDPDRLQQAVGNLLTNAIKFTPAGGSVTVRLARADDHGIVVVRDTGEGIPAATLPHVFERFRQADSSSTRAHRGLGIGLALVKHLVELHGGTVTAESAGPGLGSTFTVRLPLARVEPAPGPEPVAHADGAPAQTADALHGTRILVVDDEPDALEMVAAILGHAGAELRTAPSVAAALGILDDWRPDLVLSDIEMPGDDGYTLIQRIRERPSEKDARVPAIAVTAYGRMEDRLRALAAGFQEHVTKPFDPGVLVAAIGALLDGRRS